MRSLSLERISPESASKRIAPTGSVPIIDSPCPDALNPTLRRLLDHCGFDRAWVRGDGVWLWDQEGRRFLDCYAQYGAVALGHANRAVSATVRRALEEGTPAMVQPYRAIYAEALAAELARLCGLRHCVLASSGAEVVEAAIKLVRARSRRPLILSAEGSYHGKTMGALAATGQRQYARDFGPPPPGFLRFEFGCIDALERLLSEQGRDVAAVLLEPIQGERGVYVPPAGYLRQVRELCTRHGVALILDEIQTGLGRTGRLLACEHEGVVPDLLLLSKALGGGLFPIGACLVCESWWDEGFALRHSSTFANNNIASRVALTVLRELVEGGLVEAAARTGQQLQERLRPLPQRFPQAVAAVRGRGLFGAIELRPSGPMDGFFLGYFSQQGLLPYAVAAALAERAGVLVLPSLGSANVLRLAPPLVINSEQLDSAMDAIESVLALLEHRDGAAFARAIGATSARHEPPATALRLPRLTLPLPEPASGSVEPANREGAAPPTPSYAFILHYTQLADVVTTDPTLARLSARELGRYCEFAAAMPAGVVLRAPTLRSACGATAEGYIIAVGMLPEQMLRVGRRRMSAELTRAVDLAAALGASVVGLGGFTTPYSRRGLDVIGRGPAITTGNTLTALMAVEALRSVASAHGRTLGSARVGVVGARGSVGKLCARLLAELQPRQLLLLGNPDSDPQELHELAAELGKNDKIDIDIAKDPAALAGCELIISATGAARPVLDRCTIAPGTIICDVARPFDASPALRARPDVTVIDGGLVALPDPSLRLGAGNLQGLPAGVQLACLSETMLLALSGATADFGVGDNIGLDTAHKVRALAQQHGFTLAAPMRDGQPVTPMSSHAEEGAA